MNKGQKRSNKVIILFFITGIIDIYMFFYTTP